MDLNQRILARTAFGFEEKDLETVAELRDAFAPAIEAGLALLRDADFSILRCYAKPKPELVVGVRDDDLEYQLPAGRDAAFRNAAHGAFEAHRLTWQGLYLSIQPDVATLTVELEAWPIWSRRGTIRGPWYLQERRDVARMGAELADGGCTPMGLAKEALVGMTAHERLTYAEMRRRLHAKTRDHVDAHGLPAFVRRVGDCAQLATYAGRGSFAIRDEFTVPLPEAA